MASNSIFQNPQGGGAMQMAAPGLPAAALTGNPLATLTNISAISGAQQGAAIGNAINAAFGTAPVDPVQMQQQRQQEYIKLLHAELSTGALKGQAQLNAADQLYKSGLMAPDEYLRARALGTQQLADDRKELNGYTQTVLKSDAYKNYTASEGTFRELVNTAKRGQYGDQSANDFVLIQQGLKILDPGSIVSQNEIASGKFAAMGRQALRVAGINLNQIVNYAAGKGKAIELTKSQKERWLKAISAAVDAQRNQLESTYASYRDAYSANGGSAQAYDKALATTRDLLDKNAYQKVDDYAAAGLISQGRGYNTTADALKAFGDNATEVYGGIVGSLLNAGKQMTYDLLFGGDNTKEGAKPSGEAPRMNRGKGGKSLYKQSGESPTARIIDAGIMDESLKRAYRTDNVLHAMTMDALNGKSVASLVNTFTAAKFSNTTPKRFRT